MTGLMKELDGYENELIEKFRRDLPRLSRLGNSELENILLQRRHLSLHFTPFYDQAADALQDEEAKQVVRHLIREEYPLKKPSHREDLVTDLLSIGISKERVVKVKPTAQTKATVDGLYGLLDFQEQNYDIKIIAALRLAGEVLVAEEYRAIIPQLEKRYGLRLQDSAFYGPHFVHDQKGKPIGNGSNGKTHSDEFAGILARLVDTREKLEVAKQAMDTAYTIKLGFYGQFTRKN